MPETPVPLVHVSGSVRDREGGGVQLVEIQFHGRDSGTDFEHVYGDSMGMFTVDLIEGKYDLIILPRPGSGLAEVFLNRVAISAKSPRFDYRYAGILVHGTVLLPAGTGIDSGVVCFEGQNVSGRACSWVRRGGSYALLLPMPGTYKVRAYSLIPSIPEIPDRTIVLSADTTVEIRVMAHPVSGTIFGLDGIALAGATISPEHDPYNVVASGSDGSYQLWVGGAGGRFLVRPPNSLRFVLPRLSPFVAFSDPTTLDISLDGMRWHGTVRSSADSSVIPSVYVTAYLVADDFHRSARDLTDGTGGFEVVLEPMKEYDLSVSTAEGEEFMAHGRFASADSTFDIYIAPTGYGGP